MIHGPAPIDDDENESDLTREPTPTTNTTKHSGRAYGEATNESQSSSSGGRFMTQLCAMKAAGDDGGVILLDDPALVVAPEAIPTTPAELDTARTPWTMTTQLGDRDYPFAEDFAIGLANAKPDRVYWWARKSGAHEAAFFDTAGVVHFHAEDGGTMRGNDPCAIPDMHLIEDALSRLPAKLIPATIERTWRGEIYVNFPPREGLNRRKALEDSIARWKSAVTEIDPSKLELRYTTTRHDAVVIEATHGKTTYRLYLRSLDEARSIARDLPGVKVGDVASAFDWWRDVHDSESLGAAIEEDGGILSYRTPKTEFRAYDDADVFIERLRLERPSIVYFEDKYDVHASFIDRGGGYHALSIAQYEDAYESAKKAIAEELGALKPTRLEASGRVAPRVGDIVLHFQTSGIREGPAEFPGDLQRWIDAVKSLGAGVEIRKAIGRNTDFVWADASLGKLHYTIILWDQTQIKAFEDAVAKLPGVPVSDHTELIHFHQRRNE